MARMIEMMPYVTEPPRSPYKAVIIPLRDHRHAPRKASLLRLASQIAEIVLSLGLGAMLLGVLLLLLVSF